MHAHFFLLCFVSGMRISLFQEMGIGFDETQVLLLNNPDLSLLPLDSLRARILSLQSLGLDRVAMNQLVSKRPSVIAAKELEPLLSFLRYGLQGQLEQAQVTRLLSAAEPRLLVGFPHKVQLLVDRGVPVDKIVHVLNNVSLPKALCNRSLDEIGKMLSFLEPFGGVSLILKRPAILNFDLDNQLIPRVEVLRKISGGDEDGVSKVLYKFPTILSYSGEHVMGHARFLRDFAGLEDSQIFRIITVFPAIITASRERKLHPRIRFLKECGLDSAEIFKFLSKAPTFLAHSWHENIAYKLVLLVKIGYKHRTKDLATAMASTTRTSCENMQKVVSLFLNFGFSCEDIFAMSKKQPQILQYNHTSLEKKMNYLIEEMNRDIEELLVFPAFLGYNFDSRIKHRFEEKKGVRGEGMSLNKLLTVSSDTYTTGKRKKVSAIGSELK